MKKLTRAQVERLALLLEELGEVQHAIGKVLRHGYQSKPPLGGDTNRRMLERELGDLHVAIMLMKDRGDISMQAMMDAAGTKRARINRYLHHNEVKK